MIIIGQNVEIEITLGLDAKCINAIVLEYLGNGQYIVEGENGNRYIRYLRK